MKQVIDIAKGGSIARVVAVISAHVKERPTRVTIDKIVNKRSDYQNHALFGVAYPPLCEAFGYTKEELHTAMCIKFFGEKRKEVFGIGTHLPTRRTTTDESGGDDVVSWEVFNEFYAMVQQVGAEAGIWVPDPDRSKRR
jgi:hypothetical protein